MTEGKRAQRILDFTRDVARRAIEKGPMRTYDERRAAQKSMARVALYYAMGPVEREAAVEALADLVRFLSDMDFHGGN